MTVYFDKTLKDFSNFTKEQGFYYSDEQLYNFYISLKTKPFVIITGISGSGKSKIADLFAEYLQKSYDADDNYALVSVKPNWLDNRGIFGFHNILNETYEITSTIKLFIRALENPSIPYFLVLDEMNISKVEYYFSDFLSLLESRRTSYGSQDLFFEFVSSNLNNKITLSEAIILSALQLQTKEFRSIEEYRNTSICQWWLKNFSKGKNETAQFRTELNQGRGSNRNYSNGLLDDGTRLAGKAFWAESRGNSYKLKELSEMDSQTREKVERLQTAFSVNSSQIKQEELILHSNNSPLKTSPSQNSFSGTLYQDGNYYVPNKIQIPLNVFVIGTVNVDETTYMFSPKVLDRSNVIEFNDLDLYNAYNYGSPLQVEEITLPNKADEGLDMQISICTSEITKKFINSYKDIFGILYELFEVLESKNKHFGYRVFNEISQYIFNYVGENASEDEVKHALDIQVLQKVLPKLNGTEDEISDLMHKILNICESNNLFRSNKKVVRIINQLNSTGYATFIE